MKPSLRRSSVLLLCLLFLALRAWQTHQDFESRQGLFPDSQKGVFRVWVSEEPEVLFEHPAESHDTGRLNGFYQPLVREVRAVCTLISFNGVQEPPVKMRCTFRLSLQASPPVLSYGDVLEVEGKVQKPPPAMNPGQFDYAHYLMTRGVAYVMYTAPGEWKQIESHPPYGWTFQRWACGMKRKAEDALYRFLPFPENALLDGLLLGERGPLPSEMVENFMVTGTVHILAVSGLITAFIAGLLFMVFRALQFKRKAAAGLALVGLFFFVFMTGAHPPVCRAGLFQVLL